MAKMIAVQIKSTAAATYQSEDDNGFTYLLRPQDLAYWRGSKAFYFRADKQAIRRNFAYESAKKKTDADVVSVSLDKDGTRISFVRHHAFIPRFELIGDEWFLIVTPTYHFTKDGFAPHLFSAPFLSGKKRLDKSAALRGQVIMWHRLLTRDDRQAERDAGDLFGGSKPSEARLKFGEPPSVHLEIRVPEDAWGGDKKQDEETLDGGLFGHAV